MPGLRSLCSGRDGQPAADRGRRGGEDNVEAVTLGLDLGTAVPSDDIAHQAPVGIEKVGSGPVAVGVDIVGVAAQVAEEEPAGQVISGIAAFVKAHASIIELKGRANAG